MKILLLTFAALFISTASAATDKVVCYLGSWAVYRPGDGKYDIENIDPTLCTHLIYTFVGINSDATIKILDSWNELEKGAIDRFNGLRKQNPEIKTLIAIGGWNAESKVFSDVVADPNLRAAFIKNAIEFVSLHKFDGFDLDWEYPAQRGGNPADKENFALLVKEMREAFDEHNFLLTAAVAAAKPKIEVSYDVPTIAKYLHFINVMAYDLHGSWEDKTGQNAPLYASDLDKTPDEKNLNVDACIKSWMDAGAPAEKLILGVGVYGRTFTLKTDENKLGAPASAAGSPGPYTREGGMLGYNEICLKIKDEGWTEVWDDQQKVPYAYKGNQWVGFDNLKSATIKAEYAKATGLGGVMIWSLETDDFHGKCGEKYAFLKALHKGLGHDIQTTTRGPTTPTTSTTSKPTRPPNNSGDCIDQGFIRDPKNCATFYYCVPKADGSFQKVEYHCSAGLYFNVETNACDYIANVEC